MQTELDSYSNQDFESLYGVNRSNIHKRLTGLKEKGYDVEPEKQGTRSVYNADQKRLMDLLDRHIKAGSSIGTFPSFGNQAEVSYVSQDNPQPSYKTQDKPAIETAPASLGMAAFVDSIVGRIVEAFPQQHYADPLANLRQLQEVSDRGWLLSSSQLAPLLGLKSLHGKEFERYGFRFVKAGKNGAEAAWKVNQLH